MNFGSDQFKMAQQMMQNMKPEDLQNMMSTMQSNPHLMQQAMNMMGNRGNIPNMNNYQVPQNPPSN